MLNKKQITTHIDKIIKNKSKKKAIRDLNSIGWGGKWGYSKSVRVEAIKKLCELQNLSGGKS